ncbi:hypothetical protein, partial [Streptococcus pneumoniae]
QILTKNYILVNDYRIKWIIKMSLIYSSAKKDFLYWNVLIFIMELPNDVKVQFYELRKKVQSFNQLSKRFGMDVSG